MLRSLAGLACTLALAGCAGLSQYFHDAGPAPEPQPRSLADWPYAEIWSGVVFNGAKIGFTRLALARASDAAERWDLESEAVIRLRFLGVDKRVNLRSRDRVRADLTLERFRYDYDLDGSALEVAGEFDGRTLELHVQASGASDHRRIAHASPLYPQSALAMLPLLRGLALGKVLRDDVLQGETQQIVQARQEISAYERSELFEGPAFRVETEMLGVSSTAWIAPDGRPLFELALHGTMISALEPREQAERYLVAASLNKDEALLDFSLMKAPPLADPGSISKLEIVLAGVPASLAVPSEAGQECAREAKLVRCTVDRARQIEAENPERLRAYLAPTLAAPSADGEIVSLAQRIAGGATEPRERVLRILTWLEANVAKEAIDVFTASDVLRERRAECQGHAYLFAALSRALGLPARVVNGLVYSERHGGFLYHSWNEVWIEGSGWRAVDPTLGQPRADATHLKLIEGESALQLIPLVGMVGKARVAEVRALARW